MCSSDNTKAEACLAGDESRTHADVTVQKTRGFRLQDTRKNEGLSLFRRPVAGYHYVLMRHPEILLSDEDSESIGPLRNLKYRRDDCEFWYTAAQIVKYLREETRYPGPNSLRALIAAQRTLHILNQSLGAANVAFEELLAFVQCVLDQVAPLLGREMIRHLFRGVADDVRGQECLWVLSAEIEDKQWRKWRANLSKIEAKLCAVPP
jgi:hypothetical protein